MGQQKMNASKHERMCDQGFQVVLDAYSVSNRSPLTYVNDGRNNIRRCLVPTDEEKRFINIEFVTALVNGWPRTFGVTTRAIGQNEELFAYYGVDYGLYQASHGRFIRRQHRVKNDIEQILDKNHIDIVELDLDW